MRKIGILWCCALILSCVKLGDEKTWDNPFDENGNNHHPPVITVNDSDIVVISINDDISVTGTDANGVIIKYIWALDGTNFKDTTNDQTIQTSFSQLGSYPVLVKAIDNDGIPSKDKDFLVIVELFAPKVTAVDDTVVSQTDTAEIAVKAEDTNENGTIEMYYWDRNGDGWDDSTTSTNKSFAHPSGGPLNIIWGARDDDGIISTDSFTIRFNRPPSSVSMVDPVDNGTASFISFDKVKEKGSVRVHYTATDPDGPGDILNYILSVGDDAGNLEEKYNGKDTTVEVKELSATTTYYWKLWVRDIYGDSVEKTGKYATAEVDLIPPVVTLKGDNPLKISLGVEFTDPGATALDNVDGDVSDSIKSSNNVNTMQAGSYKVTYTVQDAMQNEATAERTVTVEECILLEDFEIGPSYQSAFGELFGTGISDSVGYWRAWTDDISTEWDPDPDSTDSAFEYIVVPDVGYNGSAGFHAMPRVYDPQLPDITWGVGFYLKKSDTYYDISKMDSITFHAKIVNTDEEDVVRFEVSYPGIDWGYAGVEIQLTTDWKEYVLKPGDFSGLPDSPGEDHDWSDAKDEVKMFRFVDPGHDLGDVDLHLDNILLHGDFSNHELLQQ